MAVATVADLKALSTSVGATVLTEAAKQGLFIWTLGNFSNQVNDLNVIAANSVQPSVGAWIRQDGAAITFIPPVLSAEWPTVADKLRERISARDFGAIGDGLAHPLSDRFSTLADAQAIYPFVTSLSQTLDWAGIQTVLNLARDSGNRKVVAFVPVGRYLNTDSLRIASNVWLKGEFGTIIDNQNIDIDPIRWPNQAQLINDDQDYFNDAQVSDIYFNGSSSGAKYGVRIDVNNSTQGNRFYRLAFSLQSISDFYCSRNLQTARFEDCIFSGSNRGIDLPGGVTNQVTFTRCEFNTHAYEATRIVGGEGVHFRDCRWEAGTGVSGRVTNNFNGLRSWRISGGYAEATNTYFVSETESSDSGSIEGMHFTGSRAGDDLSPFMLQSAGIIAVSNIQTSAAPLIGGEQTLAYGCNIGLQSSGGHTWRYKDNAGGKVLIKPIRIDQMPTATVINFSRLDSDMQQLSGTIFLRFAGLDSVFGVGRQSKRSYHFSIDTSGGTVAAQLVQDTALAQDNLGPITITLEPSPESTATDGSIRVVATNVLSSLPAYCQCDVEYSAFTNNEYNPLVINLP